MGATAALAAYVHVSGSFGSTYGPLAGIVALLLWSLMSAIAFFYGVAICAQLEALRAGQDAARRGRPGTPARHGGLTRARSGLSLIEMSSVSKNH